MGRCYGHVADLLVEAGTGLGLAVEIGSGSGQYRQCVAGRYLGIDREEYYPGGRADVRADARWLPLGDRTADLVFMVATYFLLPEADSVLAEARRVLRDGGRLMIFDYSWWRAWHGRLNWHTSRSLARRLRQAGFTPRVHWACAPPWGRGVVRRASAALPFRVLTYLGGHWVVVSGTKAD